MCVYSIHRLFADHVEEAVKSESQTSVNNTHTSLLRKGALFLSHAYLAYQNVTVIHGLSNCDEQGNFSYSAFFRNAPCYLAFAYSLVFAALQYQTVKALGNPQAYSPPTGLKTFLKPLAIVQSVATVLGVTQDHSSSFWAKSRSTLIDLYSIFTGTNFTTHVAEIAERHIAQQRRMHKSTETRV